MNVEVAVNIPGLEVEPVEVAVNIPGSEAVEVPENIPCSGVEFGLLEEQYTLHMEASLGHLILDDVEVPLLYFCN